jgi:hypothetical protein
MVKVELYPRGYFVKLEVYGKKFCWLYGGRVVPLGWRVG